MGTRTGRATLVVLVTVGLGWAVGPARGQTVIFVDASATGAGDGSNWADAYTSVQPALDAAWWAECVTGPGSGPCGPGCEAFGFEADGDVDLGDFAAFAGELEGI